ncbi:MAG: alcohol dehydrogenase catalytic domain-containing protein [Planctomycetaceae bacterium]
MRAVELNQQRITFRSDYRNRASRDDLIEVRVTTAGICETDLQLARGYMGFSGVPGHEFVGVASRGRFARRRVVGEINCACGTCDTCKAGRRRHCPHRTVIGILNHDGAFADSVLVPEENLHVVPDGLSDRQAVFAEPVAAACRILEQVSMSPQDSVVILGDGRLGNLCAQVLKPIGCRLTVVGKHSWKLQRLRDLDINGCLLDQHIPEQSADYVVDCTGSPRGFETALRTVRPCGTVILKTTVAAQQELHLAPIVIDEVTVLGSRCGPFAPALEMLAEGRVQVEPLISAAYPLEDASAAFEHAQWPDTLKVLFDVA